MSVNKDKKIDILINGLRHYDEAGGLVDKITGLSEISYKLMPHSHFDIDIRMEVLKLAIHDKDEEYINSKHFLVRCADIGLNGEWIKNVVYRIWSEK